MKLDIKTKDLTQKNTLIFLENIKFKMLLDQGK